MNILICTTNNNKVKEFRDKLLQHEFSTLKDENIFLDIEETGQSFEENALIKLNAVLENFPYLKEKYSIILAEDSGICVDSLNGAPGIYSARYSGIDRSDRKNNEKLLNELKGENNRKAHYEACIAAFIIDKTKTFSGKVFGEIAQQEIGKDGFGYDPLFMPEGYTQTFGELGEEVKLKISHRTRAIEALVKYLRQINQ